MIDVNNIFSLFASEYVKTEITESFIEFRVFFQSEDIELLSKPKLESVLKYLSDGDSLLLSITIGESDAIVYSSKSDGTSLDSFFVEVNKGVGFKDEVEQFAIEFTIIKKRTGGVISVYSTSDLFKYLNGLTFEEQLSIFSEKIKTNNQIVFECYGIQSSISEFSIAFTPIGTSSVHFSNGDERQKKIENIKTVVYAPQMTVTPVLPEDFSLELKDALLDDFSKLFQKIKIGLSIISIFDISEIDGDMLNLKLNGYKSIKTTLDMSTFDPDTSYNDYYDIYKWIYSSGSKVDKIGLARNIISLILKDTTALATNGNAFSSIISSYKIYEKQNIKQYIEIRNKISDQLLDFNNRANKIVEVFASGFQKSALALISFFISSIAIKLLGKGEFLSSFTLESTVFAVVFLIGAFIYFRVSRWEVKEQRKRFVKSYDNLKKRYTDLLEASDIQRILNHDLEFNEDLNFIDNKMKFYSAMWIAFLLLLFLANTCLFLIYNISKLVSLGNLFKAATLIMATPHLT